ncbi:MAG: hypothetical protein M1282_03515 [Chloroflexi bacterium]|nr:hypothetical protein [Chloroflexota bacterium]
MREKILLGVCWNADGSLLASVIFKSTDWLRTIASETSDFILKRQRLRLKFYQLVFLCFKKLRMACHAHCLFDDTICNAEAMPFAKKCQKSKARLQGSV